MQQHKILNKICADDYSEATVDGVGRTGSRGFWHCRGRQWHH